KGGESWNRPSPWNGRELEPCWKQNPHRGEPREVKRHEPDGSNVSTVSKHELFLGWGGLSGKPATRRVPEFIELFRIVILL
ncbi:MAG: hypothetical protein ACI9KE_005340, partial [Polyangiales bacterium]